MTASEIENQRQRNQKETKRLNSNLDRMPVTVKYPHVFKRDNGGSVLTAFGTKYSLPAGTQRENFQKYEEVIIPASSKKPLVSPRLITISELDKICQGTFKKYKSLNVMQSLVYPIGYETNENMLVCAPTGAGKTDVALLSMLSIINQFSEFNPTKNSYDVALSDFKIVYVAPLKALAAEVVEKMSSRLSWLGISVRELTGDMQLTRAEIFNTQVIVTTPEKWDVVTRKANGGNDLVSKVRLLIIDEVHLLHEDRGAVIESLVARTLRQVESTQSMVRIVGLSATLPNYLDVAEFLRVNPMSGLFFFDDSFRPVPLEQQFVAIKGKAGTRQTNDEIDRISYEKLVEMLEAGHQIMVFVHSRKDTLKTARSYISQAQAHGDSALFDCSGTEAYDTFDREMAKWKNRDMKELFMAGFGVHHAGMLRSERNLTERMFLHGAIKVLCCTATLAWGVNLPAAVVLIKGTQVYDAKRGGFVDLGISDVIQIFGRAGRPQFEQVGTGILCTTSDRLTHYLSAITQQHPIESKMQAKLEDNLNAEIALGTVTSVDEGVQWLGYTYLFVRMRKNPFAYGLGWNDVHEDPLLGAHRRKLIIDAARKLHKLQMIVFDENTGTFVSKDTGRIASDFYLLNSSVELFNKMMNPRATEADMFSMISMSAEFDGIKSREEERTELKSLLNDSSNCQVLGGVDTPQGKTNVLLQAYISKANIKDSALVSDSAYVAQNSIRISRSLFLLALNRRWGRLASLLLEICKSIEHRLWHFEHPLAQFDLPQQVVKNLEARDAQVDDLRDMETGEIGQLVHNKKAAFLVVKYLDRFPTLHIESEIAPLTKNVLKIRVTLEPEFVWDNRIHGNAEFFWIWVEDSDDSKILHYEKLILSKQKLDNQHILDFTVPLAEQLPSQIIIRAVSDTWVGAETSMPVSFQHLIRPEAESVSTKLLPLRPLPITALDNAAIEEIYSKRFNFFNPMQSMIFHSIYNSSTNVLLGSPTGSGKTVAAELAMWWAFKTYPKSKVVYIAPMKALVRERVDDWSKRITKQLNLKLVELTGDSTPDSNSIKNADIIITTPEKFDGISRNWQNRKFVQDVSLIIMDEIHLLASDRGPILEMIVSRMNFVSAKTSRLVRLLGLSSAVANAYDMASWLKVKDEGLFNFPSTVRPVPLEMYIDGFPDNIGFCPLMKSMNKPAFLAIKKHSPTKPVLIFVASRRQTRLTALDLIQMLGTEDDPHRFLRMDAEELQGALSMAKDDTLKMSLQFGIGLHHAGLVDSDRRLSHELFASNKIQILVATSTLAWGVNLPAYLVIIKGTQFYDAKIEAYKDMDLTDVLQMMGRAGRPAFDTSGVARIFTKESTKHFYKYFLNSGFPVESSLHKVLDNHLGAEISARTIKTRQEAMDFLTWTFLFRRIHYNPTYYGIEDATENGINRWMVNLVDTAIKNLDESGCLQNAQDGKLAPTPFLTISSYYYLSHRTMRQFLQKMHKKPSFKDCLQWLCLAAEYDELPVRHNEDLVNIELSRDLRFPGEEMDLVMWDPHVKSYLLLQAYMSRIELPITDYIQDTTTVLDQALRILQALVDTSTILGYLSTTLTLISVMQCLKQAYWFDDDPISVLPGLSLKSLPANHPKKQDVHGTSPVKAPIYEDVSSDGNARALTTLKMVGTAKGAVLENMSKKIGVPKNKQAEFKRVASSLPVVDIKYSFETKEDVLKVELTHTNTDTLSRDFKVYTPKFPKVQKESWFIILGDPEKDELIALTRCSPRLGRHPEKKGSKEEASTSEASKNKRWDYADGVRTNKKGKKDSTQGAKMEATLTVPLFYKGKRVMLYCINDALDIRYEMEIRF